MAVLGLVVSHVLHRSSVWQQTAASSWAVFAQESSRESDGCPVLQAGKWLTAMADCRHATCKDIHSIFRANFWGTECSQAS